MTTTQQSLQLVLPDNPFVVESPEKLTPEQIVALFITEFTDIETMKQRRHTIVWGSRGSGKSMTLRYLEPRCQQLALTGNGSSFVGTIPFIGVYCPCKEGHFNRTEFESLDPSVARVLSEHLLNVTIASRLIGCVQEQLSGATAVGAEVAQFVDHTVSLFDATAIAASSRDATVKVVRSAEPLTWLQQLFRSESRRLSSFLRDSCFEGSVPAYLGATSGYHDFLLPFVRGIQCFAALRQATVFLLIDDADRLTRVQQAIVNSWVANRDHNALCIKLSATRDGYGTLATTTGAVIEQPHDYSEIDVEEIYTRSKSDYAQKVKLICETRLRLSKIQTTSIEEFLPPNIAETELYDSIKKATAAEWAANPSGREADYVTRYASARLFQELRRRKRRKSYAGFPNLVHISSGVIRDFLEPCYLMVDAFVGKGNAIQDVQAIPPSVQDDVIYQYSEDFLQTKMEDLRKDLPPEHWSRVAALRTLIESLGRLFYERLHDPTAKEARLFSFTVRGSIPAEMESVLRLGLRHRYFQRGTYSSKEGGGREDWYILNRRLSPVFKLDPTGFEGRISLTPEHLQLACQNTAEFLRLRLGTKSEDTPSLFAESTVL